MIHHFTVWDRWDKPYIYGGDLHECNNYWLFSKYCIQTASIETDRVTLLSQPILYKTNHPVSCVREGLQLEKNCWMQFQQTRSGQVDITLELYIDNTYKKWYSQDISQLHWVGFTEQSWTGKPPCHSKCCTRFLIGFCSIWHYYFSSPINKYSLYQTFRQLYSYLHQWCKRWKWSYSNLYDNGKSYWISF